ncbi:hypothetical protein GCM10020255_086600 [Rhodococcus baikonurensis]
MTANDIPIRDMALQYNFVFDRKGKGRQLNDANWPQFVSTLTPPTGTELADGTYRPILAPVNFSDTTQGAQYFTNWYTGPLSPPIIADRINSYRATFRASWVSRRASRPISPCRTTNATCSTR